MEGGWRKGNFRIIAYAVLVYSNMIARRFSQSNVSVQNPSIRL